MSFVPSSPANGDHFLSSGPTVVPGTGSLDLLTNANTEQGFTEIDQDLSGVIEPHSCRHVCLNHTIRRVVWDSKLRECDRMFRILRIFRTEPKLLATDWFFKKIKNQIFLPIKEMQQRGGMWMWFNPSHRYLPVKVNLFLLTPPSSPILLLCLLSSSLLSIVFLSLSPYPLKHGRNQLKCFRN